MKLKIYRPLSGDVSALKRLWQTSFADSGEYIDFMLERLRPTETGLAAYDGEQLAAMLFLLPALLTVDGIAQEVRYVYAAATDPAYRRRGIFRALEEAAGTLAREEGATALALIPESPEMFDFYQRLGYRTRFYLAKSKVPLSLESRAALSVCPAEKFLALRRGLILRDGYALEFASPELCALRHEEYSFPCPGQPGGELWLVETSSLFGYAAGYFHKGTYVIQETDLSGQALSEAAGALAGRSGAESVVVLGRGGRRFPFGMLKLLEPALDPGRFRKQDFYMNLMFN